ncbi:carboxylating nicotinate-nucleotide diphosphorylase [Macrococcus sp. CCM 2573]
MNRIRLQNKLRQFMDEDIQYGDLSSSIFEHNMKGTMHFIAKESGYFSGNEVIVQGFNILSESDVTLHKNDGDIVVSGETIVEITGNIRDLLQAERTVLNIIQRMSGITTLTKQFIDEVAATNTRITDTRKTTPGLGMFEKYAVQAAGATNHRRSLNDGIMLKDNHIAYAGSISKAVQKARTLAGHMDKIEVEIEDAAMLQEAIESQVDIIMFDNCTPEFIKEHIDLVPDTIITEASGGITLDTVRAYAEAGVDYISVGQLFHSSKGLDISGRIKVDD